MYEVTCDVYDLWLQVKTEGHSVKLPFATYIRDNLRVLVLQAQEDERTRYQTLYISAELDQKEPEMVEIAAELGLALVLDRELNGMRLRLSTNAPPADVVMDLTPDLAVPDSDTSNLSDLADLRAAAIANLKRQRVLDAMETLVHGTQAKGLGYKVLLMSNSLAELIGRPELWGVRVHVDATMKGDAFRLTDCRVAV